MKRLLMVVALVVVAVTVGILVGKEIALREAEKALAQNKVVMDLALAQACAKAQAQAGELNKVLVAASAALKKQDGQVADQRSVTEKDLNRFGLTMNNSVKVSAKKQ